MTDIVLVAHNLRSTHNVGSLLRTADGLGVKQVILSGYTPYPVHDDDDARLPHLAQKIHKQISKTSLGAELALPILHSTDIESQLQKLRIEGYQIVALEQTPDSIVLPDYEPAAKVAIILGREVEGLEADILALCDVAVEIPMFGQKESFNVVQAAAMALYHCRFFTP